MRLGLIEAAQTVKQLRFALQRIRGACASASLKQTYETPGTTGTHPYPRRMRLGLIEASRTEYWTCFAVWYPRRMRLGLIEA